ncbi:PREDICTED: uncharacterized protein LOC109587167 [Amphimedon queenslandica]|uniref:COR domain-containing protein n=1 Tax=Amphimedon queenslandica TaxID=400682 RepID=A0AAN0JQ68_AMPQE|nr:PREDICTED: uncharacterized protein LOC109587167 [Amphimedon queenslandica]|eukprot:XP_019858962.1 PREDICTED: uncharacterized protein LOC109587167 [Amphimedon queenslandica]
MKPKKDYSYDKEVAEKEVNVAYSRIMLLGSAGVGKTCFTRSLMKEKYQSDTDSTIISDVKSVRPIDTPPAEQQDDAITTIKSPSDKPLSRTKEFITPDDKEEPRYKSSHNRSVRFKSHMLSENKKWKQVDENDEIDELAYLITAVYDKDSGSEDLRTAVAALLLYKIESPFCPSDFSNQKIHREEVDSFLEKAIKRAQMIGPVPIQDIKPQPFMHIWDCGGQAVFLEILPAFLSSRTMFFLLFNGAKSLDEKWKNIRSKKGNMVCDEVESISTKNLLFNWMANIHHHLARIDEKGAFLSYPRIYCIGTHGDLINHDEQIAAIEKMKSTYKNKAFSYLIKKVLIVDNTTAGSDKEDPNFSVIREEVSDFTCNKLIVKTPVSWVLFRKVIKLLGTKVIGLKEAHKIGLACKIPHNDVPKVLLFYHDLGVLLYYPFIKGLQDRVIISPQWFVDTLGEVFTLEGRENQDATEAMWNLLREKGILVQPLYQEVWKDCKEIEADDLMELLVHFCLAAEVETDQFFARNAKQYFLPAVLKSYDTSYLQSSCDDEPVARATNIYITFSTDFVPPGFFTRFIASFAKVSSCKICFEEGVFRNRIVFKFGTPSVNQVTFTDLCTTIRVSVERYSDAPNITPFSNTCQELKSLLEKCGNEVDIALGNHSDFSKSIEISRKLNYECTACDKYELHYISPASGQTANLPFCCQKRKNYRQPTPEESYWFPKEEQTAENVPVTISEKEMAVISKRVGDKADTLAACMEMLLKFKALQQNPAHSNNPMLHLLYEWKSGGGYREDLIEALKSADLHQLADQVKVSDYRPASGRLSVVNIRQPTNEHCSDFDPSQNVKDIEAKNSISNIEITEAGVKATRGSGQLNNSYTDQQHQEQQKFSEAFWDIEDDDLLRSSNFFDVKDIKKLVEICDDDSGYLQSVMDKYQHSDAQTIAIQVLRALVRKNPSITKKDLKKKLHLMKFEEAANNLSEPFEATKPAPQASQPAQSNTKCFVL